MRFAAQLSEVPFDARNLLGIECSAAYAQSVSQQPGASQHMVPAQVVVQPPPQIQHEYLKRRAEEFEEVAAKRSRSDQPDLEGHFWSATKNQMQAMRP